ncbi:MAG: alanine racemase, partial [Emcibacteraceae bacterium]|nr:alanine racemase [Emcibacteraceae bacterium]
MSDVLRNSSAELRVEIPKIIDNYQLLEKQSSSATCSAVVKADAYGLGIDHIAPALFSNTACDTFFVASIVEAVELRAIIKEPRIYVFNGLFAGQVDTFVEHNITPILNDLNQIGLWQGRTEPCAIHFDTGINRLGLMPSEADRFFNEKQDLNVDLVLSHFIQSEIPNHPSNQIQLDQFCRIRYQLPNAKASLCNSAGIFLGKEYHFDMLRPGIMLYGGNPGLTRNPHGIKQAFEIHAQVLQIRELEVGMSVGYNSLWTAPDKARVAILNVGYADGTLKTSDHMAKVFIGGHMASVVGKVSMDMIAIDISDDKFNKVTVTDFAEVTGANITLEKVAENSTLSHYELLTGI